MKRAREGDFLMYFHAKLNLYCQTEIIILLYPAGKINTL